MISSYTQPLMFAIDGESVIRQFRYARESRAGDAGRSIRGLRGAGTVLVWPAPGRAGGIWNEGRLLTQPVGPLRRHSLQERGEDDVAGAGRLANPRGAAGSLCQQAGLREAALQSPGRRAALLAPLGAASAAQPRSDLAGPRERDRASGLHHPRRRLHAPAGHRPGLSYSRVWMWSTQPSPSTSRTACDGGVWEDAFAGFKSTPVLGDVGWRLLSRFALRRQQGCPG